MDSVSFLIDSSLISDRSDHESLLSDRGFDNNEYEDSSFPESAFIEPGFDRTEYDPLFSDSGSGFDKTSYDPLLSEAPFYCEALKESKYSSSFFSSSF